MGLINFFKEVKAELAKVVWPTKSDTVKYTLTVIFFSVGVAVILGLFDYGLLMLTQKIITKN